MTHTNANQKRGRLRFRRVVSRNRSRRRQSALISVIEEKCAACRQRLRFWRFLNPPWRFRVSWNRVAPKRKRVPGRTTAESARGVKQTLWEAGLRTIVMGVICGGFKMALEELMSEARLLLAQGPSQLISALAVWEHLASQPQTGTKRREDVLVLGGFCAQGKTSEELDAVCRQIAHGWTFQRVVSIMQHDAAYENGQLTFEAYGAAIAREIGSTRLQEIYVCRNMQPWNEAVLFAWPAARKVCYGDMGMIDLNSTVWCRPTRKSGYPQVDEIITYAPVEVTPGVFDDIPVSQVPARCLINALTRAGSEVGGLKPFCQQLLKDAVGQTIAVCLSNLTESGTVSSLENELLFYQSCLEPFLQKGNTLLLKGHPRETRNQSQLLADRLRSHGCQARSFTGFSAIPLDLFATTLKVDLLVTLLSHSGVLWRLQQPETDILLGVPSSLTAKFFVEKTRSHRHWQEAAAVNYLLTLMATRREFKPVRMKTLRRHLKLAPACPILLKGRANADADWPADDPVAANFYRAVVESGNSARTNPFRTWTQKLWRRVSRTERKFI